MQTFDWPMLVAVIAITGIFGVPVIGVVGHFACSAFKTWQENSLKRDMVARGYTAHEIIEVVAAKRGRKSRAELPDVPPAKPVKQPTPA
jgi:hypothetical protein